MQAQSFSGVAPGSLCGRWRGLSPIYLSSGWTGSKLVA